MGWGDMEGGGSSEVSPAPRSTGSPDEELNTPALSRLGGEALPGLGTDYKVWGGTPQHSGRRLAWGEGL